MQADCDYDKKAGPPRLSAMSTLFHEDSKNMTHTKSFLYKIELRDLRAFRVFVIRRLLGGN